MGGHIENPTYEQVKSGTSGHLETVEIQYDVALFSYNKLLEIFFSVIDPLDTGVNIKTVVLNIKQLFSTLMIIKRTR